MGNLFIGLKLVSSTKEGLGEGLPLLPPEPSGRLPGGSPRWPLVCAFLELAVRVAACALSCSSCQSGTAYMSMYSSRRSISQPVQILMFEKQASF